MCRALALSAALLSGLFLVGSAWAREDMDLPAGPVRDRHKLMEEIGKNAKIIGEAMKAGDNDKVIGPAKEIVKEAKRIPAVFPAGSEDPKSRARPEIWSNPKGFAFEVSKLEEKAAALAFAAETRDGVPEAAKQLFGACKSCHDNFRVPEE